MRLCMVVRLVVVEGVEELAGWLTEIRGRRRP